MNILLINHYAGSLAHGMEFRPFYMAREWVAQGHNVTIIASSFSHLRQNNPVVKETFTEEVIDGIRYVWVLGNAYVGTLDRIRNIASFVCKLFLASGKIAKQYKPDLVIASSTYPIDNVPARRIAKKAEAKHCYEAHDIWPLSPMVIGGYSKFHPFILVMKWAEKFACKKADKVISLLWNSEGHYISCGMIPGRFACVPNGCNIADWSEERKNMPLPEVHQKVYDSLKGKIIVGFAGGLVPSGALGTLLQAAEILREFPNIHFVLAGKGPEKEALERFVLNHGLQNVSFLPPVPKELIPALDSKFDIAYMGGVHSELHKYGTSYNKMTDYLLSGKPIIQAIDEPGCVVEKTGCGIQVEAENPKKVADAILRIANMTESDRAEMGRKGKEYAEANLDWSVLAGRFLSYFSN